jgi:uncharacterized protein
VPLKTYDASILVLRSALDSARAGDGDKLDGMRRLDKFVRAVEERYQPEADFDAALLHEHSISREHGGRTVFDDRRRARPVVTPSKQLELFQKQV